MRFSGSGPNKDACTRKRIDADSRQDKEEFVSCLDSLARDHRIQGIKLSHSTGQNQQYNYFILNILLNVDKGIEPSRRRTGGSWLTSRMVEPAPPSSGPASRIKSTAAATAGSRSAICEQPV